MSNRPSSSRQAGRQADRLATEGGCSLLVLVVRPGWKALPPGRALAIGPTCRRPCSPRLSAHPDGEEESSKKRTEGPETRFSRYLGNIDPALWSLPRFFGGKVASTALQPFRGCRGG